MVGVPRSAVCGLRCGLRVLWSEVGLRDVALPLQEQ